MFIFVFAGLDLKSKIVKQMVLPRNHAGPFPYHCFETETSLAKALKRIETRTNVLENILVISFSMLCNGVET